MGQKLRKILFKITDILGDSRLLSFIFPFLTVILAFAILQVYPVGDRTVLTVDLYHQYMPFIYEFRQRLLEGRSLFYSWNTGLGTEYFAAYANYAASPLNLLCIFFPYKTLPVFVAVVTAIRAGLASLFMGIFLSENDEKRYDFITVIFGASYALCGWFLSDFWNIMWCDAFVLLPLIALGLRKLFLERKYTLYIVSLGICIASNFYSGYFICLFLVFYSVVLFLTVNRREDIRFGTVLAGAVRFAVASLTAGAMSAVMVLPTYMILKHSSATGDEFPMDFTLTGNLFDFLGRLMMTANPNIRDGMANVACGIVVVLMIPLFFMASPETGIKLRHKIGYGFLMLLMYLSFSNRALNFIWHGFHFPNQIPYRQSFIMCFILVSVAFMTIRVLRYYTRGQVAGVCIGAGIFLVLYEKFGTGNEGYQQIGLTLLFLIIQGCVLASIRNGKRNSSLFYEVLITVTVLIELFASTVITIARVAEHEGFPGYDFYAKNRDIINTHVEQIEGTEGHNSFERTELYPNYICCIQSVYDVKGLSIFSSTARESFVKYMRNFGFHNNGINGLRNPGLTRVTATLLDVRNLATIENTSSVPSIFEEEYSDGEVTFYGNPDALPVGYMVSPEVLYYVPDEGIHDVFYKTNSLVRAMGVEADVYHPVNAQCFYSENLQASEYTGSHMDFQVMTAGNAASAKFTISDAQIGNDVYIYLYSPKGGNVKIERGEEQIASFEIRSYQIICLGTYDGTPLTATVSYNDTNAGTINFYAYELDRAGYDRMVSELSDEVLEVTYYDDTTIRGTVTAENEGLLFLTIPYAEGFHVTVDGAEAELLPVQDALSAIRLTPGEHQIELKYVPAGFRSGAIISGAGVICCILLSILSSGKLAIGTKKEKIREPEILAESESDETP